MVIIRASVGSPEDSLEICRRLRGGWDARTTDWQRLRAVGALGEIGDSTAVYGLEWRQLRNSAEKNPPVDSFRKLRRKS